MLFRSLADDWNASPEGYLHSSACDGGVEADVREPECFEGVVLDLRDSTGLVKFEAFGDHGEREDEEMQLRKTLASSW